MNTILPTPYRMNTHICAMWTTPKRPPPNAVAAESCVRRCRRWRCRCRRTSSHDKSAADKCRDYYISLVLYARNMRTECRSNDSVCAVCVPLCLAGLCLSSSVCVCMYVFVCAYSLVSIWTWIDTYAACLLWVNMAPVPGWWARTTTTAAQRVNYDWLAITAGANWVRSRFCYRRRDVDLMPMYMYTCVGQHNLSLKCESLLSGMCSRNTSTQDPGSIYDRGKRRGPLGR